MRHIPRILNCAAVKVFAVLDSDSKQQPPKMLNPGRQPFGNITQLAICQKNAEARYELYYCDDNWKTLRIKYFTGMELAMSACEDEYPGISAKWIQPVVAARLQERGELQNRCAFCGEVFNNTDKLITGDHADICYECLEHLYNQFKMRIKHGQSMVPGQTLQSDMRLK